jgi:glycosyltransferase involved in cell wall biosynthesis
VGNPIVASRRGGIPELLTDQQDALLIEPDAASVYHAIKSLIVNPALGKRLGANAQQRAANDYTWKGTAGQFMELYRKV